MAKRYLNARTQRKILSIYMLQDIKISVTDNKEVAQELKLVHITRIFENFAFIFYNQLKN